MAFSVESKSSNDFNVFRALITVGDHFLHLKMSKIVQKRVHAKKKKR